MNPENQEQHRIVVGVDGSLHSTAALRWALRQALLTGATIDAVACWLWTPTVGFTPTANLDLDLKGPVGDAARSAVADAVAATPQGELVVVQVRVVEGQPAGALVEAGEGADLLVVGSRGHGQLSGVLLGSVGLHCASHATCPVLIVREEADLSRT